MKRRLESIMIGFRMSFSKKEEIKRKNEVEEKVRQVYLRRWTVERKSKTRKRKK